MAFEASLVIYLNNNLLCYAIYSIITKNCCSFLKEEDSEIYFHKKEMIIVSSEFTLIISFIFEKS